MADLSKLHATKEKQECYSDSTTFFRMCANFLVTKCRSAMSQLAGIYIDFFQDDILICSSNRDALIEATRITIETLKLYGLIIPDKKDTFTLCK